MRDHTSHKPAVRRGLARTISVFGTAAVLLAGTAAAAPAAVHSPGGKKQDRRASHVYPKHEATKTSHGGDSVRTPVTVTKGGNKNASAGKRGSSSAGSGSGGSTSPVGSTPPTPAPSIPAPPAPAAPEIPTAEELETEVPPVEPEAPVNPIPPVTTPTPGGGSTPGLLFDGSRVKDFGVEAAPGAVTEVPDPLGSGASVLDMTVHNSDVYPLTPTDNPRAQALSPAIIHPEGEYWLSTEFFIPKGMPYVSGWLSLVSIYGPPFNGSSPWQISINEHELRWMRNFEHDNDIPWKTSITTAEGKWTSILLHEKFGTSGFVEMWVNGQQITFFPKGNRNPAKEPTTSKLEMATMDSSNDAGLNSAKIMQYRMANMFEVASVYFSGLKVGTTRNSVES